MIPEFDFYLPRNIFLSRFYFLIIFLFLFFSTPPYIDATRVKPMKNKNTMERNPQKKLRKLPHVFSRVLELPFKSDTDVAVEEVPDFLRFVAETEVAGPVRAHAVEIIAGVIKIIVRTDQELRNGAGTELLLDKLEVDAWRYRLPASTLPELATAAFKNGKLTVTVPKDNPRPALEWREVLRSGRRLVLVQ